jgi:hypothetical protein
MFELAKLIEKYDVNAWWLFEGHGPIFGQSSPRAARLAQASNLQVRKRGRSKETGKTIMNVNHDPA